MRVSYASICSFALASLIATGSQAQITKALSGISLRAGFFRGNNFNGLAPTPTVKLEGLQFGIDIPIYKVPVAGTSLSLSGTYFMGGGTRKGNDNDANVYRLMALTRSRIPTSGLYAIYGLGYAEAKTRGTTNFDTKRGFIQQIGIGKTLSKLDWLGNVPVGNVSQLSGAAPFIELSYINGKSQYKGYSLELGVRF
ncbi:MAG: hypothetical protein K8R88_10855 [Armatimonadetes bacterium]|nr:hypothetical protein [Armatimonadota bacterium]